MARSISEIKTSIGNAYIAQMDVQTRYSLTSEDVALGFDALFSKVSVESMKFYAYAFAIYTFELIMDAFRVEIQAKVNAAFVANEAWWHSVLDSFQKGYDLNLNPVTFKYEYESVDASAQVIKRRAVRQKVDPDDNVFKVFLYVAGENGTGIVPFDVDDKFLIDAYAKRQTPSGVLTKVISGDGDELNISLTVNFNPLLLNSDGELINDATKPVDLAASKYVTTLNDTAFGGRFNVTKFIDMIQSANGVVDAKITALSINSIVKNELWGTFESTNGWFKIGTLTVIYQPQTEL